MKPITRTPAANIHRGNTAELAKLCFREQDVIVLLFEVGILPLAALPLCCSDATTEGHPGVVRRFTTSDSHELLLSQPMPTITFARRSVVLCSLFAMRRFLELILGQIRSVPPAAA